MRISFGKTENELEPTVLRYDVAWCIAAPEFRQQSKKICWWLDLCYTNDVAASARLKELQGPISQNNGNLAIYEVHCDKTNRIVSERVIARTGGERPPFRSEVQVPGAQLKAAFEEMVRPPAQRPALRKNQRPKRIGLTLSLAAGFSAMIGIAVFFAGTSLRDAAERTSANLTVEAERLRTEPGRILVPRGDSLCDRLLFDNQAGGMKVEGSVPCTQQRGGKPEAATFTSNWPGKK